MQSWYSHTRMNNDTEVLEASDMEVYEVGFHIIPKVAEGDVPAEVAKIKEILSQNGASVIAEEAPRMIQLSYEMARKASGRREAFSKAYFGWVKFEANPDASEAIGLAVAKNANVLRSILISTVRESTLSKKIFVSEHLAHETIKKPEMAKEGAVKMSDAEIDSAVDELVGEVAKAEPAETKEA